MADGPWIALIGTLDTKSAEIAYVRDRLRALGARPIVIDTGILGEPSGIEPDIPHAEVAAAAGDDARRRPRGRLARRGGRAHARRRPGGLPARCTPRAGSTGRCASAVPRAG